MNDIPIKYINGTGSTDFQVVVFSKNFSQNTPVTLYSAWQVLRAQTSVQFTYPMSIEVGASFKTGGQTITAGPFPAMLGSTWEILQPLRTNTAELREKTGVLQNPNNTIVIKNVAPSGWSGRKYDIEIYKSNRLFVTEPGIFVDSQVDFVLEPKLYFGVARNIKIGQSFQSIEMTSSHTLFDLSMYPNGIIVTLDQMPGGGQYVFTAEYM